MKKKEKKKENGEKKKQKQCKLEMPKLRQKLQAIVDISIIYNLHILQSEKFC